MGKGTAERVAPAPLVATSRQRRLISGDDVFRAVAFAAAALILVIAAIVSGVSLSWPSPMPCRL